jgi:pectate lyase
MLSRRLVRGVAVVMSTGFQLGLAHGADGSSDPARAFIAPNDGFASVPVSALPQGTIGGGNAAPSRSITVTNRKELIAALAWPDPTPKLIYVKGSIDVNVDDSNSPLRCIDYVRADPATGERFSLYAFMAMYDPAGPLAKKTPFGGQEYARVASAAAQEARVHIRVPPNTTLFGVGSDATLVGAWLDVRPDFASGSQPMNVIIRNLTFLDTVDCFPEWSPNDGTTGNWNAQYDSISVRNATHVWIDHNRFADVASRDDQQPNYFGHRYQLHDGQVDITHESDYVTLSWNRFATHDKSILVGSSDESVDDRGKLRVTLHHNLFDNVSQRMPRVRFGQVHVYDNLYRVSVTTDYRSSFGAGVESQIYAENNYFDMDKGFGASEVIDGKKGTRITTTGNCWVESGTCGDADFAKLWNAVNTPKLKTDAGWVPTLYGDAQGAEPVSAVKERVLFESGPGHVR